MYGEEFEARARAIFEEVDKDGNGWLDSEELRHCVLRLMPPEQAELIQDEETEGVTKYDRSVAELIHAFCLFMHQTSAIRNFGIEPDQIADFVRFCLAWRLYAYFCQPKIKKTKKKPTLDIVFVGGPYAWRRDVCCGHHGCFFDGRGERGNPSR